MTRPFLLLLAISLLYVGTLGLAWLQQPPSNHELLANLAKAQDYAAAAASVGGIPWWTPNYLQGSSLTFLAYGGLTNIILHSAALVAGDFAGPKLAVLAFLLLCPLTMWALIRRLCPASPWTAFSCGVAYLLSPAILLRLGDAEHAGNVLAFAMLPAAFLGVLYFLEERTPRGAILCAVANALLVLAYVKIAVLVLPLMAGFALWVWMARTQFALPPWRLILLCLGLFALLAAAPNLPSLREMSFVVKFDHGPFAAWQKSFSSESALSWIDRDSLLTGAETSRQSEVRTRASYLGLCGVVCIAGLFFLRRRDAWFSPDASVFRLFIGLALTAHWLGLGVHNPITGQLAFLAQAGNAWDPAIALSWVLLVIQGVLIFLILPGSLPSRPWWAGAAMAIYFLVPGFKILEKLPLYGDIRAPHDFFEMGGVFCFSIAAGIAAALVLGQVTHRHLRVAAASVLILAAGYDSASAVPSMFKSPMDRATFEDFLAAQRFLREDPSPGNVLPFSGRYFYLMTPLYSGRPVIAEAFTGHLMMRGVAELQRDSYLSKQNLERYFDVTGVAFLLIDKRDPDTSNDLQESLRSVAAVAFENDHFLILKNPTAFAPAAFSPFFTSPEASDDKSTAAYFAAADRGMAAISGRTVYGDNKGQISTNTDPPRPMAVLPPDGVERLTTENIRITPPAEVGWLILPEAFHPDWTAFQNGSPVELAKAFGALLAIRVTGSEAPVILAFRAPWWYFLAAILCLGTWLGVTILLLADRLSLLPQSARAFLARRPVPQASLTPIPALATPESPQRPLLVIPTYNEARGVMEVLDRALASSGHLTILVVDDRSPDGTGEIIRRHPEFGNRIHLVERAGKLGLGSAYAEGFRWALERDYDACLEMDADLSHDPADIPRLLQALGEGADVAIGSRYRDGVRVMNWPQDRLFLSLGASKFVRFVTGLPLTDATSGFKAIRSSVLRSLDWSRFKAQGYGFQIELHYFLWKSGARLAEVPIIFTERREGNTKMTTRIAAEALQRVLQIAITGK